MPRCSALLAVSPSPTVLFFSFPLIQIQGRRLPASSVFHRLPAGSTALQLAPRRVLKMRDGEAVHSFCTRYAPQRLARAPVSILACILQAATTTGTDVVGHHDFFLWSTTHSSILCLCSIPLPVYHTLYDCYTLAHCSASSRISPCFQWSSSCLAIQTQTRVSHHSSLPP